ncbi:acyl-CoA thioesterase [Mesorhizobium sp. Root554]|uniref:arylesterase n=1 Tax=unclassified Mesorhizobium TaxID=325217 RepID=UPI0006F96DD9|nr:MULTISPECIES: arylesterase [unclassified Mesorhizobium]KQZ14976.1 acyl-CoA thioesterase [Mesorhizobium sp. Root1471]KQZ37485.1 acyl-CoA thioesterase [Mesorhizobium sp. Root554]
MAFKRFAAAALVFAALAFAPAIGARAESLQIVGFGDSLMAGYGLNPGEAFPEKLQAALRAKGHDVVIANAGVSGDTSSGALSRLDWSVPDGTQLVILEIGANDMLRGIDPELVEQNLDKMLARLKARNIPVLLAGMLAAPNLGHAYGEAFGSIYPKLAEKYGATLYPFFLDGVAADKALLLEDGMHPSAGGIDRIVERILPTVQDTIAKLPPRQEKP